jgi:hypothetical protein
MGRYLRAGRRNIFFFTLLYIVLFSIGFLIGGDYEFFIYTVVMLAALFVVTYVLRDLEIPNGFLWALSGAGVLHMLGGGVHIAGERLYGLIIYPFYISPTDPGFQIFRYDQFVHLAGYGVIALCIHYLLCKVNPQGNRIIRALVTIFVTMGLGSFNEIAEFCATISLPSTGVGDYSNTLLDLISNTLGAIIAVSGYEIYLRLKKRTG